jgi:hypothetical protein
MDRSLGLPEAAAFGLSRAARSKVAAAAIALIMCVVAGAPQSHCGVVACKLIITIKTVHISDVQDMQRMWTAELKVDRAHCATTSGRFEIDFLREKEIAPDMQFTQQFVWQLGEIKVSVELWWDEVVADFRIGFIAPCVCQTLQF